MATSTANMSLTVPSSGDADYPTSISDSLTAVDDHDHSSGKGVQIPTSGIVDSAITENKIADSAVATAKLANLSVTTGKIAAQAVTQAKIADQAVGTSQLGNGVVVEANIASNAVTTAKIADSNVTPGKLSSTYSGASGNFGAFSTSSTSWQDVTNSEFTATSRGRFMMLLVGGAGGGDALLAFLQPLSPSSSNYAQVRLLKNGSEYQKWSIGGGDSSGTMRFSHTSLFVIDAPSVGNVTYKLQAQVVGGGIIRLEYCALNAIEIF